VVVISDRERAAALDRARAAGVEAVWLNPKTTPTASASILALVRELEKRQVGLVCQAGYMRILSAAYIRAFYGRALNVHPRCSRRSRAARAAPGARARREGDGRHVHFADEGVDTGPIVLQAPVPVLADDTEETLSRASCSRSTACTPPPSASSPRAASRSPAGASHQVTLPGVSMKIRARSSPSHDKTGVVDSRGRSPLRRRDPLDGRHREAAARGTVWRCGTWRR